MSSSDDSILVRIQLCLTDFVSFVGAQIACGLINIQILSTFTSQNKGPGQALRVVIQQRIAVNGFYVYNFGEMYFQIIPSHRNSSVRCCLLRMDNGDANAPSSTDKCSILFLLISLILSPEFRPRQKRVCNRMSRASIWDFIYSVMVRPGLKYAACT